MLISCERKLCVCEGVGILPESRGDITEKHKEKEKKKKEKSHDLLLTLLENLSSVLSGVRVTRSLVLYVCFVDRCLSFCTISFGHCVVSSSSIYGF